MGPTNLHLKVTLVMLFSTMLFLFDYSRNMFQYITAEKTSPKFT